MRNLFALVLIAALATGCKKSEKKEPAPAPATTDTTKPTEAAKPTDPAAQPADPAAAEPTAADPAAAPTGGAAGPRPASVTDAHVALAEKMVTAMKEFGDALRTAGTDCKAATAAVKSFGPKLKPIMEEAEKVQAATDKDPAAKEWFDKTYGPKVMEAMGPMMTTAQACSNDKDFMAAMQALPVPGGN